MFGLLFQRRFLPFFLCQFLGAFNDSIFRLALVAMLSFGVFKSDASGGLIQLSAGIFMLPFFLFSAVAGDMADKLSKRQMLIAVKAAELVVMGIAAAAVLMKSLPLALLCLFFTGVQSAFFGPLKFSLLPALLTREQLLNGNSWFSVSTFAAILGGTVLGTLLGSDPQMAKWLVLSLVAFSLVGLATAVAVPPVDEAPPQPAAFTPLRAFGTVMRAARADRQVFRCILAGSWFWLVGTLLLGEIAQVHYAVYTTLLVALLVGTVLGAVACQVIFQGKISTAYAPLTLLLGSVFLFIISRQLDAAAQTATPALVATVTLFATVMTIYVVPLRTVVQVRAPAEARAKVIAAYNIFNALFIVIAALLAAALHFTLAQGATQVILIVTSILGVAGAAAVCSVLPLETVRRALLLLLRGLFNVRVQGLEHLNEKSTLICNHQSFWDGLILAVFLQDEQRRIGFAIDAEQTRHPVIRQVLKLVHYYPLNPMEPLGVRTLIREVQKDKGITPLIFPEGRITVTGNLMKCYPGAAIISDKISGGKITPIIIDGLHHSKLSRMKNKLRLRPFPPVTITVFPPQTLTAPPLLRGARKYQWLATHMGYELEERLFQVRRGAADNLTQTFAAMAERHGKASKLFSEFPLRRLTYKQVFMAANALGAVFGRQHTAGERVGFLLPSSVGAAVSFYAAQFQRLTPVMLNPGIGSAAALSCCRTATLKTVYTSQRLLERAPAVLPIVDAMREAGVQVVMLEDVREQITLADKLSALGGSICLQRRARQLPGWRSAPDEHAVVLFTSGSEGAPKGVVLSHHNVLTNGAQVMSRVDVTQADILLNALPVFHSFGLLAGVVLPVMAGTETWQYPSPLHYKMVPEAIYASNATVFFSANTFLYHYGRTAHALDARTLRLVFAGAEKLRDDTRGLWMKKFGIRILEGYGVTETSPALAVNSPLANREGTVGRLLPGVEARLDAVEGVEEGGRLVVRGDNIMAGYFMADAPGVLKPPPDGWHDTGDIVDMDEENYITIKGRAKRFVKIAGEMVPLDGVEDALRQAWQDGLFAVVGISDKRRGEGLALVSTVEVSRGEVADALRAAGLPELWQPRRLQVVKEMPLLSTGKVDYPAVARLLAGDSA